MSSKLFDLRILKTYIQSKVTITKPIFIDNIPDNVDNCYGLRLITKDDTNPITSEIIFELIYRNKPDKTTKEIYDDFLLIHDLFRQRGTYKLDASNQVVVINMIDAPELMEDKQKRMYVSCAYSLVYKDRKPTY